jgi:choice-of-anchor B domain-containing protein
MSFPFVMSARLRRVGGALAAGMLLAAGLFGGGAEPAAAQQEEVESVADLPRIGHRPCVRGFAGPFRCNKVNLMTFLPIDDIGGGPDSIYGGPGNDVWGWTDPKTHTEWVIAGRTNGTSFIDANDPKNPVFVANLPANGEDELHSDMKVYKNHAFIVKDGADNGIQVFDLTRLRDIDHDDAPVTVDADTVYEEISNAHDIAINEDTGFAYALGATGGAIGQLPNVVTIDAPSSAAGTYQAAGANFGPAPDATGVSGDVVLVDDGVETTTDGCQPLVSFPAGSIALVDRGACNFTVKANNAQDAGAVAMIVANNSSGAPFNMGGSDPGITIPSVMISLADGDTIKAGLSASGTISANPDANPCDGGGLHMVDIRDPKNPTFAGCFDDEGYVHDAQCVTYSGPDDRYEGRELCFNANPGSSIGDAVTIVDVTDHANPVMVSQVFEGEPATYSHQGWLTPDHRYFLHDDESDNGASSAAIQGRTRTRVFDLMDLEDPFLQAVYHHPTRAPAHNLYTRGRYMYNANYIDGLRIVNITKIDHPGNEFLPQTPSAPDHQGLREAACFDTDPFRNDMGVFPDGRTAWGGSWSNYPYFKSGVVVVSDFDGLFLVKPRLGVHAESPPGQGKNPPTGNPGGNGRYAGCLP